MSLPQPQPPADGVTFNAVAHAARAAASAAQRAGVEVSEAVTMERLRDVSGLLESVWGRNDEGVPVTSEVMRGLLHAGGCVTIAHDTDGGVVGAAVLAAAPARSTYSLIAAVAPGCQDRGVGRAVKLRQRAWALEQGRTTMTWTFDPLVGRNARFNLVRLGALATQYEVAFYGQMDDNLNGSDDSDRFVARWRLDTARTLAAVEDSALEPAGPHPDAEVLRVGPDDAPLVRRDETGLWCRVPGDIVALRRDRPDLASRWRLDLRDVLTHALSEGLAATHMSRTGWYFLTPNPNEETA
ncbi:MAG: hypothetical protein ABIQ59_03325 [Nocardioidaceae bacterium]